MAAPSALPPPQQQGGGGPSGYHHPAAWDEMVTGGGAYRPHWHGFLASHGPLAAEATATRWEAARRLLFQNGVTYHRYGETQDEGERLWPLDPIPLLIDANEWQGLAAGLQQRARLLEAVLSDLLGPQDVLHRGVLPPAFLLGAPGFLRACHGLDPRSSGLDFLAVDLVRGPDGAWQVLSTRAQSPTGAGYALENRMVLGQTLGPVFHACRVSRIAPFFEAVKAALGRSAPRCSGPDGSPRGVFLTPGPLNEAYFEHAYLTRYLGLTLVEGADLTVRDQAVYLKTLAGLERVDVIVRRVDDDFCDPLELRADSQLGIAGLLQTIRAGQVSVSNRPGAGLIDSPGLLAFTDPLCWFFLGEAPRLRDVPTLWGGWDQGQVLLGQMGQMVLRPAYASATNDVLYGPDLSGQAWSETAARIRQCPEQWVGQTPVPPSTAPVWRDNHVEARPLVLRTFLCRTEEGWQVMPGGLGRLSADPRFAAVSLQNAVGAKDVWIVHDTAPYGDWFPGGPDVGREPGPVPCDLPSRAADHLFWVGRYAERADAVLRLLRAGTSLLVEDARPGAADQLTPLLRLMGWAGMVPWDISQLSGSDARRGMRLALEISGDPLNPGGLRACIDRLRRAAGRVRDRLPEEIGRILARLDRQSRSDRPDLGASGQRLDDLAVTLAAFTGLELDGMSRGPGWRFLVIGRRLERAIGITGNLTTSGLTTSSADPSAALEVLLELAEARPAYRERHPAGLRREDVLSLLLADSDHPRCLAFQLTQIAKQVAKLPPPDAGLEGEPPMIRAAQLLNNAIALTADPAVTRSPDQLARMTERFNLDLRDFSNLFSQAYFSHVFARPT